jgi:phage replication O-like protein O
MRVTAPNYTQIPNNLLDEWIPKLSEGELRVILVIMRKTFGWHKIRDQISLSQLEKHSGLQRQAILAATKSLENRGLISKTVTGENGTQKTFYELVIIEDSNNLDQYDRNTPPSVIDTPTKENPTKEKKTPQPPKGAEVALKERIRKEMLEVSNQEFNQAWAEYEQTPKGQVKAIKPWLKAVIERLRQLEEDELEMLGRARRHAVQARRAEARNLEDRKMNPRLPGVVACREQVEFTIGSYVKVVKYSVSDQEWEKETGWKALNEGDI